MKRAIALARRGRGRVSPNPLVGAVVVRNGKIVGEGHHLFEQKIHAEVMALQRAGKKTQNATLYLNLEPCVHQGRTGPCVERILEAGVQEIFVSVEDPNPLVKGRGIRKLRRNGVRVQVGLCRDIASCLNEKFFHFITTGTPFVLLKLALTLDGKITSSEDSRWITGTRARREAHRLRYEYDAILVGVGTILQDDPALDVRWSRRNEITKVILDSRLRTPSRARIFHSGDPVIIFHSHKASRRNIQRLSSRATLLTVPQRKGLLDWLRVLTRLGKTQITSLLVEGGGEVATSLLQDRQVQKVNFFYGSKVVGGSGRSLGDLGANGLEKSLRLRDLSLKRLSPDFGVEGYLEKGTGVSSIK